MAEPIIAFHRVNELVDYDPLTGIFKRKIRTAQRHKVGDRADFLVNGGGLKGYHRVALDSQRYLAHRVAWLITYGDWPCGEIDHIDGDRTNNRIVNLRDVVGRVNVQNIRLPRKFGSSGYLGVHAHQGRWVAKIQKDRKSIYIGIFDDPKTAHLAYLERKRLIHEGCTI